MPHAMHGLSIDQLLRVAISLFIVLATMMLGIGESSATLTLITLGVAIVSAYVCEFKRWYYLGQPMADALALGVIAVAAAAAYPADRAERMLMLAHLQSYLQYVLLFQPTTPRNFWLLGLLSLGQVAIASTLIAGPIFGAMLLAYLFVGIFTFVLLLLDVDARRFRSGGLRPSTGAKTVSSNDEQPGGAPVLFGNSAALDTRAIFSGVSWQTAFVSAFAVLAGGMLFFLLPRWDVQYRQVASTEALHTVGFSNTVTLGELGEVVDNPDVVMRIQFFHGLESRPFKLVGEPLFRGTVVSRYSAGAWTQPHSRGLAPMPGEFRSPFVRQRISIEPMDVAELFCVFPVFAIQTDPRLRIDSASDRLLRQEDTRSRSLEVELGTTGIASDRLRAIVPCEAALGDDDIAELVQIPQAADGAADPFAGLRATALRALEEKQANASDRVAAARALSNYLSYSGRYLYSLEPQSRDRASDPLEDFVTKNPQGHCEYFAGALALMLRSQGIPARLAIGFKGGEWNSLGMYYQVQQLHAHAWVEVYLSKEDIPPGTFDDELAEGAWLVLDPTEGAQQADLASRRGGLLAGLYQYLDYAQVLWANYVVGLNSKRQRQGIYEPFAQGVSAAVDNLVSRKVWENRLRAVADSHLGEFWQWYRRHWFSWRGGLVAVGFSLFVVGLALSARWLLRAIRRLRGGRFVDEAPVLEMYRRLEAVLARRGLARAPAQTAYEFAVSAGGELAERLEHRGVAHLPRRIVDTFYRVRFGGRTLDKPEAEALEHALAELERALIRSRR